MRKLKVTEVELFPDDRARESDKLALVRSKRNATAFLDFDELEFLADAPQHKIYGHQTRNFFRVYAIHNKTKQIDMTVKGVLSARRTNWQTFTIHSLVGRKGSTLKAYEFYRTILKARNYIFTTRAQTIGGMKTWQKLAEFSDITVFGWVNGQVVNIDPSDQDQTHVDTNVWYKLDRDRSGSEFWVSSEDYKDTNKIRQMNLVAHRTVSRNRKT